MSHFLMSETSPRACSLAVAVLFALHAMGCQRSVDQPPSSTGAFTRAEVSKAKAEALATADYIRLDVSGNVLRLVSGQQQIIVDALPAKLTFEVNEMRKHQLIGKLIYRPEDREPVTVRNSVLKFEKRGRSG